MSDSKVEVVAAAILGHVLLCIDRNPTVEWLLTGQLLLFPGHIDVRYRQGVDLGLRRRGQAVVGRRMKLVLQPALGAHSRHLVGGRLAGPPGDAVQQGQVVGAPVRSEFQVTTIRTVAVDHGLDRQVSCELGLAVHWRDNPPLRLAGSCPGEAQRRVTLGISASF